MKTQNQHGESTVITAVSFYLLCDTFSSFVFRAINSGVLAEAALSINFSECSYT
jgi:hypothetical protein